MRQCEINIDGKWINMDVKAAFIHIIDSLAAYPIKKDTSDKKLADPSIRNVEKVGETYGG